MNYLNKFFLILILLSPLTTFASGTWIKPPPQYSDNNTFVQFDCNNTTSSKMIYFAVGSEPLNNISAIGFGDLYCNAEFNLSQALERPWGLIEVDGEIITLCAGDPLTFTCDGDNTVTTTWRNTKSNTSNCQQDQQTGALIRCSTNIISNDILEALYLMLWFFFFIIIFWITFKITKR